MQDVQRLEKKLQRNIQKSAPYFEQKESFNKALEQQYKLSLYKQKQPISKFIFFEIIIS